MCGIYGWDLRGAKVNMEQRAMIAAILAVANDTRGGDSWGFWNGTQLHRGLGDISNVAVKTVKNTFVMAHTRKATTGATTIPNAHPFPIGDIIGAHNGMISNHSEMNTKHERKHEVDSMHLFSHLNDEKDFSDLNGYGAIEFIRKSEGKDRVNLCKLSGGDLTIVGLGKGVDNYSGVLWSSNGNHLEQALKTAGVEFFKFDLTQGQVYQVYKGQASQLLADNKPVTLELGTRNNYTNWTHGRGFYPEHTSSNSTPSDASQLSKEEYNAMLASMSDDEERQFFELWAKEEGIEVETVEVEEEEEDEDAIEATKPANNDTETRDNEPRRAFSKETNQWVTIMPNGEIKPDEAKE